MKKAVEKLKDSSTYLTIEMPETTSPKLQIDRIEGKRNTNNNNSSEKQLSPTLEKEKNKKKELSPKTQKEEKRKISKNNNNSEKDPTLFESNSERKRKKKKAAKMRKIYLKQLISICDEIVERLSFMKSFEPFCLLGIPMTKEIFRSLIASIGTLALASIQKLFRG